MVGLGSVPQRPNRSISHPHSLELLNTQQIGGGELVRFTIEHAEEFLRAWGTPDACTKLIKKLQQQLRDQKDDYRRRDGCVALSGAESVD
jgi:hypothetical protein